jgi:HTH-type transcriptional regulator/antitoxin HigA
MEIRPIHTKADYKDALREVSAYFDNEPEPGTPDGDRFEVLLTLVES